MGKRLLIVDQEGDWGQRELFPDSTEITVVSDFDTALLKLQPEYNFKDADEKLPTLFEAHKNRVRGQTRRPITMSRYAQTELEKFQLPYWDGVMTDFYENGTERPMGLTIAHIAALHGVRYIGVIGKEDQIKILDQPTHVSGVRTIPYLPLSLANKFFSAGYAIRCPVGATRMLIDFEYKHPDEFQKTQWAWMLQWAIMATEIEAEYEFVIQSYYRIYPHDFLNVIEAKWPDLGKHVWEWAEKNYPEG